MKLSITIRHNFINHCN